MNTDQKLLQLVDKLLVKTQDNLCTWRKNAERKYILSTPTATIEIYYDLIIGGTTNITMEINRDKTTLISIRQNVEDTNSTLVRLFYTVTQYYQNYVDQFLDDILIEIQKK